MRKRVRTSEKVVYILMFCLFAFLALLLLYPCFWIVLNSLKDVEQYYDNIYYAKPFDLPSSWHFGNYIDAFVSVKLAGSNTTFFTMLFNTLWYSAIHVFMAVFVPMCTAYAMAKYSFKGRSAIYMFVILTMVIPVFGTGGAMFSYIYDLGLYNNPLFVVFTGLGGFSGSFLIMYGFFKSVSWEYAEAVFIDGGNDYTVFFKIMLPIAVPLIVTFSVLGFIASWNDYSTMLIYLPSYPTLAMGVFRLSDGNDSLKLENPPVYFAMLTIMALPLLIVFIFCSNIIMENLSIGGIKG